MVKINPQNYLSMLTNVYIFFNNRFCIATILKLVTDITNYVHMFYQTMACTYDVYNFIMCSRSVKQGRL